MKQHCAYICMLLCCVCVIFGLFPDSVMRKVIALGGTFLSIVSHRFSTFPHNNHVSMDSILQKSISMQLNAFLLSVCIVNVEHKSLPFVSLLSRLSLLSHCFTLTDCSSPIWSLHTTQPGASICWWHSVRSHCIPRWTLPLYVTRSHTSN